MFKKNQLSPVTLQLALRKVCSLFVEIIFDVLVSDYVKEQEMLSATELGDLRSLARAASNVEMKGRQIQIAVV